MYAHPPFVLFVVFNSHFTSGAIPFIKIMNVNVLRARSTNLSFAVVVKNRLENCNDKQLHIGGTHAHAQTGTTVRIGNDSGYDCLSPVHLPWLGINEFATIFEVCSPVLRTQLFLSFVWPMTISIFS